MALSSYLGNTIEYYDFILYGSAAGLIFGPLFFSDLSPALATMASFATFATGYIARPGTISYSVDLTLAHRFSSHSG
ncbi:hypothetical protein I1A62_04105 (plasmid) [Rhodococcus sp. USK10]|uniref:hypothetical protein n=1 Tax=Rhodococcus sp. USK10 TaxID=2789739 RepID=UPI001C5E917A|nr:hypothetical protein I1A62_04105 [Rhodococcus sp. USK10]